MWRQSRASAHETPAPADDLYELRPEEAFDIMRRWFIDVGQAVRLGQRADVLIPPRSLLGADHVLHRCERHPGAADRVAGSASRAPPIRARTLPGGWSGLARRAGPQVDRPLRKQRLPRSGEGSPSGTSSVRKRSSNSRRRRRRCRPLAASLQPDSSGCRGSGVGGRVCRRPIPEGTRSAIPAAPSSRHAAAGRGAASHRQRLPGLARGRKSRSPLLEENWRSPWTLQCSWGQPRSRRSPASTAVMARLQVSPPAS